MSETADIVITVEKRTEAGKSALRKLRREGKVPAVLYGADKETVAISVEANAIQELLKQGAGTNTRKP